MGSQILIGSKAAAHWFPDWIDYRPINDIDYISKTTTRKSLVQNNKVIEFHYSKAFDWLLEHENEIASPNSLYTIKVSHSFWDVHWRKTMNDILFFQNKGCEVIPEFFDLLYKDWLEIHDSKKRINFGTKNSEFFKSTIDRVIPHDTLHEIIVQPNQPIYKSLKYDQNLAKIEGELFDNLTYENKCRVCLEETYVIALERFLIPTNFKTNHRTAFYQAAKKVIVDLNEGFVPYFFVTNWKNLSKINEIEYSKAIENTKQYLLNH